MHSFSWIENRYSEGLPDIFLRSEDQKIKIRKNETIKTAVSGPSTEVTQGMHREYELRLPHLIKMNFALFRGVDVAIQLKEPKELHEIFPLLTGHVNSKGVDSRVL